MNKTGALRCKAKGQGGFTLIEMLIVVAIIAILVAVSIPMMNGALEDSRKSTDLANMRSAKAWAQMDFLKGSEADIFDGTTKDASNNYVGYYDAAKGVCVATKAEVTQVYGQTKSKHDDVAELKTAGAEGKVLMVTIDPDGDSSATPATPPGAVTLAWE